MGEEAHHVFRKGAYERYLTERREAVVPQLIAPRGLMLSWLLLAILVVLGLVAWSIEVPVHATAVAVVVGPAAAPPAVAPDPALLVLLEPADASGVRPGQEVVVSTGGGAGDRLRLEILAVDATPSSPAAIRRRFSLEGWAATALPSPRVVATARFSLPEGVAEDALRYEGSVMSAEIEVGRRRVLALVPGLRSLVPDGR